MACTARVLVVGEDSSATPTVAARLEDRGFQSLHASSGSEAIEVAGNENPDVVIINAAGCGGDGIDLGKALRSASPTRHIPVIVIGDRAEPKDVGATIAAGDEFLPPAVNDAELFARLHSLVRLSTMKAEVGRRSDTARKYGLEPSAGIEPPREISDAHLLIVAKTRGEFESITQALGDKFNLSLAASPFEALDLLNRENVDAVIASVEREPGEILEFCGDIRNNTRLYNTPVLLVAERESFQDPELPYRRGASEVLYRPLDTEILKARTETLVKEQRYRLSMQETYREALHIATSDSLTGLYNHGFLHQHLASVIEDAERWNKHLTVGYFDVARMAAINQTHGYAAGDHLLRQIGGLIGSLVRGEDLAARYNGEEFCVILPETAPDVAEVALKRIAGVIGSTEFALAQGSEAFMVRLKVGRASAEPGDTPESLIARARADMASELADS